jgi:hypothetical protein
MRIKTMGWWIGSLVLLLGCPVSSDDDAADDDVGDDDAGDDDAGDDDAGDDDALDPCTFHDPPAATVDIAERYHHDFGAGWTADVFGRVMDGPDPSLHQVLLEQGECRYLQLHLGFCDPPCGGGEVCNAIDECEPYPEGISAGTLTIDGLAEPLEIAPEEWIAGLYYGPFGLPADLFAQGDVITVSFSGDALPATSWSVRGVAPIDPDLADDEFELQPGGDNVLNWTAGDDPGACVETLILGINETHGAPIKDVIWCVGPDDGELVIPQALVDTFPLDEIPDECIHFDCLQSQLTRYTAGTIEIGGVQVRLVARSSVYFMGGMQMGK